jgi:hypothetical protein
LELPFGGFYKTQIAPFFTVTPTSLWPWGDIKKDFFFTFAEPYYEDTFPDFGTKKVRIFFKYTNDNNPFQQAIITPATVLDGVSQVGGNFALISLLGLFLYFYNVSSFEKSLVKRYRQLIAD